MSKNTQAQQEYLRAVFAYSRAWDERGDVPKAVFAVVQAVHNEVVEPRDEIASLDAEVGFLTETIRKMQGATR